MQKKPNHKKTMQKKCEKNAKKMRPNQSSKNKKQKKGKKRELTTEPPGRTQKNLSLSKDVPLAKIFPQHNFSFSKIFLKQNFSLSKTCPLAKFFLKQKKTLSIFFDLFFVFFAFFFGFAFFLLVFCIFLAFFLSSKKLPWSDSSSTRQSHISACLSRGVLATSTRSAGAYVPSLRSLFKKIVYPATCQLAASSQQLAQLTLLTKQSLKKKVKHPSRSSSTVQTCSFQLWFVEFINDALKTNRQSQIVDAVQILKGK